MMGYNKKSLGELSLSFALTGTTGLMNTKL